jgi:hypothetical protein
VPVVQKKQPPPQTRDLVMGPAVGRSDDFYALAYSPELDDEERYRNPEHSAYTHILRYQLPKRDLIARVPVRLDALWRPQGGPVLALGEPLGYLEVTPQGVTEVALPGVVGQFSSIWGFDDSIYACGCHQPIVYVRLRNSWMKLPLPRQPPQLRDVGGLSPTDVYFVGDHGSILHFDGRAFTPLEVPTTCHLTGIVALDEEFMVACGYGGVVLMGNKKGWCQIPTRSVEEILAIARWDGAVYFGLDGAMYRFDGTAQPQVVLDEEVRWVSGLADGLVIVTLKDTYLLTAAGTVTLDTAQTHVR